MEGITIRGDYVKQNIRDWEQLEALFHLDRNKEKISNHDYHCQDLWDMINRQHYESRNIRKDWDRN
jgi:hypothetical protein